MADWYQQWLLDKKKRDQQAQQDPKTNKVNFHQASMANNIQYTLPGFTGRSGQQGVNTQWEKNMLQPLSIKKYGRSYEDKFNNLTKSLGMSSGQASNFRTYLDSQEQSKQTYNLKKDGTPDNRHTVYAGQGMQTQNQQIDGILNNMNNPNSYNNKVYSAIQKIGIPNMKSPKQQQQAQDSKPHSWIYNNVLNPVNNAVGGTVDYLERAGASGVDALTAGQFKKHINDASANQALGPAAQQFAINETKDPTNLGQKAADVAGNLYATAPLFMGVGKAIDPLAKLLTANKYGQAAIRGGLSMGSIAAGQNAVDAAINPNDATLGQRAKDVGLNTLLGAGADVGLTALGPVAQRILGKVMKGKSVSQVAKEEKVPEDTINKLLHAYDGRKFQTESSGQIIDPNAPQLPPPTQEAPLQLNSPQGLPEPLINRNVEGLGKDVQVKGTPQLEAPKTGRPIQSQAELDQLHNDMLNVSHQRQALEDQHVQDQLAPFIDSQKQQAQAEQTWNTTIKQAKEEAQRIKDSYGKIAIPKGSTGRDIQDQIPAQFKAAKGASNAKAPYDIYKFAEDEGFSSPEEAVQYLKQLDENTKVKLKDLAPNDGFKLNDTHIKALEDAARKSFADTSHGKAVDSLLNDLMGIHKAHTDSTSKGDPLLFKKEKQFKVTEKPVSYTRKMDPNELKKTKFEGSFSTKQVDSPFGDTLKIKTQPKESSPFKRQVEQQGMKQTVKKEVTRKDIVEKDGRKPVTETKTENVNNSQAKPETSSNLKPMGIRAGQPHVNDISWVEDPKNLARKIKDGDVSLGKTTQAAKTHLTSDLQFVKDIMRNIAKKDMGQTLNMMGRKMKDVSYEDNLFKGLRGVRRAVSEAINASKHDYGKIIKNLRAAKISQRDANEYFDAVHFKDVLDNNHAKAVREGEVSQRLQDIEHLVQHTNNKKALKQLADEETKLLKEKDSLKEYSLPKKVMDNPDMVNRVLSRWENTPAMIQAQKDFMAAQRKDLELQVKSGLKSQAEVDAMISKHPNYVYMGRMKDGTDFSNGAGGNISKARQSIKARKNGSEANKKYTALEGAIQNRIMTYHNARRNMAMQTIEKIAEANGGDEFFTKLNPHVASDSQMQNTVKFFKNGEVQHYEVPPLLKQAFDNLDTRQAKDLVTKTIKAARNTIAKGATYFNTDFIFSSPLRETNALITSRTNLHPGQLVVGYLDSFLGKGLEKASGGVFKSYKEVYHELGGHYTGNVTVGPQDMKQFVKQMDKGNLGKGIEIVNPATWITKFGASIEHGPKLAEFRSAKGKGYSDLNAMHEAADVIDYTDLGTTIRTANNYVPFLGPMVRGTTRYFQAMKENPAAWLGKNLMYITAPTIGIYMTRFAPWATDEQRSKINNMPAFQKNIYWSIPAPDGKSIWAIPKMHVGAQLFANPVERVLDQVFKQDPKTIPRLLKDTGSDITSNLTPPNSISGLQLIMDSMANYNRMMGMPIEDASMLKNPDPTQHFNSYTSEMAKELGKVTGGSPAKWDYIIKGMTGGTGRDALDVIDNTISQIKPGSRPSKVDTTLDILNPTRRFVYKDTNGLGTTDRLYQQNIQDKYDKKTTQATELYKQMGDLNKQIKAIREDTKLSSQEKKDQISALRAQQRKVGDTAINSGVIKNR